MVCSFCESVTYLDYAKTFSFKHVHEEKSRRSLVIPGSPGEWPLKLGVCGRLLDGSVFQ